MAFLIDDETSVSAQDAFNSTRNQPQPAQTNFQPPQVSYGDANQALNYGDNNTTAPSYDYSPPVASQSAYDLNYGPQNNGDANNDGMNDQTGLANGVVQDSSSPSGYSYNGIPTTWDGAQYNPGPQQPQADAGYNFNFASPLGGTANDAPVAPYTGPSITGYPGDPNAVSYPGQESVDYYNSHYGGGGGGFLDTLGNVAGDIGGGIANGAQWLYQHNPNASFGMSGGGNDYASINNPTYEQGNTFLNTSLLPSSVTENIPNPDYFPARSAAEFMTSPAGIIMGGQGLVEAGARGVAPLATRLATNALETTGAFGAGNAAVNAETAYGNTNLPGADFAANPAVQQATNLAAGAIAGLGMNKSRDFVGDITPKVAKAYKSSPLASEEGSLNLGGITDRFRRTPTPPDIKPVSPVPTAADLGDAGIRAALSTKELTTREAGPIGEAVGKIPGVRKAASLVNPSVTLERPIHVANQAEAAVKADLATRFAGSRKPLLDDIKASGLDGGPLAPEYIGPPKNPIKDTFIDRVENPQDYRLTDVQKNIVQRIASRDAENVNAVRSQYNADIGLYTPKNADAAYVPHINANEDLIQRSTKAEAALTNPRVAKERVYDTARERALASDKFKPETDPARLLEAHDNAIASMAGKETFKAGVGGLNKAEAIAQFSPGLAKQYDALKTRLQSMKGTASRLDERTSNAIDTFLKSGQTEEDMAALRDSLHPVVGKNAVGKAGPNFGKDRAALNNDIATVKRQIDAIRPAWKNYNLQERGLELSPYTYKYHSPETNASIASVKETSNGRFIDKVTGLSEVSRESVLGSDISPLTIQGQLQLARNPVTNVLTMAKMIKEGGANLAEVARTEPEMVSRFTQARGRALGDVSKEFDQSKSLIARIIPGAGTLERKMFQPMQRIEYEAWKAEVGFLQKLYPNKPQAWLDHEAANALSKTNPALSSVERGVSPARGALERTAFTSTSFLSSPALVMKDATSALVKLAGLHPKAVTGREAIALKHVLTIAGTIEAASLTSAVLNAENRGRSPEEAIKKALIPGNKEFMALQVGDVNVPLGGPFRSVINGLTPRYRDGAWQGPDIPKFLLSRTAPLARAQIDLLRNKDYFGNDIMSGNIWERVLKGLEYEGEAFTPLTAGAVPQGIREGKSARDIGQDVISQGMGSNVTSVSVTERLNRLAPNGDFYSLPPSQQREIYAAHPDLQKQAIENGSPQRQEAAKVTQDVTSRQQQSDTRLDSGEISPQQWRDDYHSRVQEIADKKDTIYANAGTMQGGDPVLDGYFKAIDGAKFADGTIDWDKVDAYVGRLQPEQQKYIDANTGLSLQTDRTKEYKTAVQQAEQTGYFDLKEKAWDALKQQYPDKLGNLGTFSDYKRAEIADLRQQYIAKGDDPNLASRKAAADFSSYNTNKVVNEFYRTEYRHQWVVDNPDLAREMWGWGIFDPDAAETKFLNSPESRK